MKTITVTPEALLKRFCQKNPGWVFTENASFWPVHKSCVDGKFDVYLKYENGKFWCRVDFPYGFQPMVALAGLGADVYNASASSPELAINKCMALLQEKMQLLQEAHFNLSATVPVFAGGGYVGSVVVIEEEKDNAK